MSDIGKLIHDLEINLQMMAMADEEWVIQDGCSWRRIGTRTGRETDGTVLRPYVAPDGHPDLQSAYGVLLHIILAQPRNVRKLVDEILSLRKEVEEAREALAPFAACVFSDNADVTVNSSRLCAGDFLRAAMAIPVSIVTRKGTENDR